MCVALSGAPVQEYLKSKSLDLFILAVTKGIFELGGYLNFVKLLVIDE